MDTPIELPPPVTILDVDGDPLPILPIHLWKVDHEKWDSLRNPKNGNVRLERFAPPYPGGKAHVAIPVKCQDCGSEALAMLPESVMDNYRVSDA